MVLRSIIFLTNTAVHRLGQNMPVYISLRIAGENLENYLQQKFKDDVGFSDKNLRSCPNTLITSITFSMKSTISYDWLLFCLSITTVDSLITPLTDRKPLSSRRHGKLFYLPDSDTVHPKVFGSALLEILDESSTGLTPPESHVRYRISEYIPSSRSLTRDASCRSEKFRMASNLATLICILDCTLLPMAMILLPVLNLGIQLETIHRLGHIIAVFLVIPIGALTTILNFVSHRRLPLLSISFIGLTLIWSCNSHAVPLEFFHHGIWHRILNILGCIALLSSNYFSHRLDCKC
jgi:MerC mercury resistance protein